MVASNIFFYVFWTSLKILLKIWLIKSNYMYTFFKKFMFVRLVIKINFCQNYNIIHIFCFNTSQNFPWFKYLLHKPSLQIWKLISWIMFSLAILIIWLWRIVDNILYPCISCFKIDLANVKLYIMACDYI